MQRVRYDLQINHHHHHEVLTCLWLTVSIEGYCNTGGQSECLSLLRPATLWHMYEFAACLAG